MKKAIALLLALVMCLSLCACGNNTKMEENREKMRYLFDEFETATFLDWIEEDFQTGKSNPAFEEIALERISTWKNNNDIINILRFGYIIEKIDCSSEAVIVALNEIIKDDTIQSIGVEASFGLSSHLPKEDTDKPLAEDESYWYDPLEKKRVSKGSIGTYFHRTECYSFGDFILVHEDAHWYDTKNDDNGIEDKVGISLLYGEDQAVLYRESGDELFEFWSKLGLIYDDTDKSAFSYWYEYGTCGVPNGETWADVIGAEDNYNDTVYVINDAQGKLCLVGIRSDCFIVLCSSGCEVFTIYK